MVKAAERFNKPELFMAGEYVELLTPGELAYVTVTSADGTPIPCFFSAAVEEGGEAKYWFFMPDDPAMGVTVHIALPDELPEDFGPADVVLPESLSDIEAAAFENDALITAVDAHSCAGIGEGAFRGCTGLQQILLPKDCTIAPNAFTLCCTILVYAPAGGTTEAICDMIANCVFVEYGQN